MLRVGLTGGAGSGKSETAAHFAALGVPVLDADAVARRLSAPGQPAAAEILAAFGEAVRAPGGGLDRARLRRLIFADAGARARLEAILHPRIRKALEEALARLTAPYVLLVVPLLVEKGWTDRVDRVLVVDCPESLQIRRLMARDGLDEAQARAMLAAQASREVRLAAAHDVIHNEGDLQALRAQVEALHRRYLELAGAAAP